MDEDFLNDNLETPTEPTPTEPEPTPTEPEPIVTEPEPIVTEPEAPISEPMPTAESIDYRKYKKEIWLNNMNLNFPDKLYLGQVLQEGEEYLYSKSDIDDILNIYKTEPRTDSNGKKIWGE